MPSYKNTKPLSCPHLRSPRPDPYLGHGPISLQLSGYITSNPSLHCPSSGPAPISPSLGVGLPMQREPLDIFIARIIHISQVPTVVPDAALYILSATTHHHGRSRPICPSHTFSSIFHTSSLAHLFSHHPVRSPFSRTRKPHWVGHHYFLAAFMVAVRMYENLHPYSIPHLDYGTLSLLSGVPHHELKTMCEAMSGSLDRLARIYVVNLLQDRAVPLHDSVLLSPGYSSGCKPEETGSRHEGKGLQSGWEETYWEEPELTPLAGPSFLNV
ncbi:hypothetical protein P691DRAFT_493502 [Macrolepiota fuliginosa MF-IS2]|uniref:Uncharacterized protein n=1 Tax=Macrolepiota fuliginosa MF-IS2 TaxID=1400762 RepID=A0A9P6C3L2_9AGAR|nr:hypothetical protein P691DRAFT_493502 [Macrolepiota fuliginosa MF-IS2]